MRENVSVAIEVDHKTLKELIKLYYKKKQALFISGTTGIGKSYVVRDTAKELAEELGLEYSDYIKDINNPKKFLLIDVRLSQLDPSDLRGIPVWDKEKGATVWLPPESFPRDGKGIIFFDELNLAPPLVQASAYQMILDRRLGTYVIPEGYMLIGAGNRLEDRANVFEMAAPLKNRFGHCQLTVPTVEAWTEWASKNGIDIRIIGFLNFKRTALFTFDGKNKEYAFATPRAWESASILIKEIPSNDINWLQTVVATKVGVGIAGEFAQFIRIKNKLKPVEEYLKNPDKIELPNPETEIDVLWALTTSLVEYYASKKTKEVLRATTKLLMRMSEEFSVFVLKMMASIDKQLPEKLPQVPEASKLYKKLLPFID